MYLGGILQRHRLRAAHDTRSLDELVTRASAMPAARGFRECIERDAREALAVVAEIKRRSPSRGVLREGIVAGALAAEYERGGATCLSVLTDTEHFFGSPLDLAEARAAVSLPVLRKDFVVDARDVCDARLMGADCVLLIVAALEEDELRRFHDLALEIGLDALVETHDVSEVETALAVGARMIGVNQRDLVTFRVDHERAARCREAIPAGVVCVAESGIRGPQDARRLRDLGWDAILVGETLVTSDDPTAAVASLRVR